MNLEDLTTPCLVLDEQTLDRNIRRMHEKLSPHRVRLRPHVKTAKCPEVVQRAMGSVSTGITVSTLKEAEYFFDRGIRDILYAVGISPQKLGRVAELRRRGADLAVILDSVEAAVAVQETGSRLGVSFPALIEIDSDGHRAGVQPDDPVLLDIGRVLAASQGAALRGVMTHAGASYDCRSIDAIRRMAERERQAVVRSRDVLRAAGLPCLTVSVGSTPTAVFGESFAGVTEVRAGLFVFYDLVMVGLGVSTVADVAMSVLVSVIGHQNNKGWIITDGGWMALSRDRGTATHAVDQGYGMVCDLEGSPIEDLIVVDANQEHGVVARRDGKPIDVTPFQVGTRLRVLPNHACATAAQHSSYHVVRGNRQVVATWDRFGGW